MTIFRFATAALGIILACPRGTRAAVSAQHCPQDIDAVGEDAGNWTSYGDWDQFLACNEKLRLFKLPDSVWNTHNENSQQRWGSTSGVRACTSLRGDVMPTLRIPWDRTLANFADRHLVDVQVSWSGSGPGRAVNAVPGQASSVLFEMSAYISLNAVEDDESGPTTLFAQYGDTAVGVYIGEAVSSAAAVYTVLQQAIRRVRTQGGMMGRSLVLQYCKPQDPRAAVGVWVDTSGGSEGLAAVRDAVAAWDTNGCIPDLENSEVLTGVPIWASPGALEDSEPSLHNATSPPSSSGNSASAEPFPEEAAQEAPPDGAPEAPPDEAPEAPEAPRQVGPEASPEAAPATSPDAPLEAAPEIATETFPGSSSPTPGLHHRAPPTRNADGSCVSYFVNRNETCDSIARAHSLKANDILKFNKDKTWAFKDCPNLQAQSLICLSEGDPPLPVPLDGLQCGPQKPGTQRPTNGTALAALNPCPLNVCCSQHGFCGLSDEHCAVHGDVPGVSGCLSNCERGIINNREPPKQFLRIGYFEAWNANRPCLHMGVDEIDTRRFTHIHFAFGRITPQWAVDMGDGDLAREFRKFVQLRGVKRIVSFGGWADSTEPDKYWIFRQAVQPANRARLAENLAKFVKEHDLDGIDIDWEYPAAPDLPDIPRGEEIEGEHYLSLIALLRVLLPRDKTISIAAPASYWYLKGIPIKGIAEFLDYIVYMTYDLHGQWDTTNKWAQSGCEAGNCLRSHVNYTETIDALSMITRAGIPAGKVIVGVTSYGRSFRMAEKGCKTPMCTFLGGPKEGDSPAQPGPCTDTGGYISNAEIDMLVQAAGGASAAGIDMWYDSRTMTDYLVYNDVEWVAYMTPATKARRTTLYERLNFGGVTDWAIDLESFSAGDYMTPSVFKMYATEGGCGWSFADSLTCSDPAIKNASMEKSQRWDELRAGCAWRNLTWAWDRLGEQGQVSVDFPAWMSDYFAGPTNFNCRTINGCSMATIYCPTAEPGDTTGPGSQLILDSFAALNRILSALRRALDLAYNGVDAVTENFIQHFAQPPEQKDLRMFNIVIDVLGMGLSMVIAPLFNNIMKIGPKFDDNIKDSVYGITSWGLSLAKDVQTSRNIQQEAELQIREDLKYFFLNWGSAVEDINMSLFSGSKEANAKLFQLMDGGTLATGGFKDPKRQREREKLLTEEALGKQVEKVAFAQMIPQAWYLAGWRPLVAEGGGCDDVGAVDEYVSRSGSSACYDGKRYYLVAAPRPWATGTPLCFDETPTPFGSPPPCWTEPKDPLFEKLPGMDKLGDRLYGEVSLEDIIIGSVETWRNNGNKNGGRALDFKDKSQADKLFNADGDPVNVRAPGVFRLPVCSAKDAYETWKKRGKNWPAPKDMPESFPCP